MSAQKVRKAYIQHPGTKQIMSFQYNPEMFRDSISIRYIPMESPGMSYPMFQYVGGEVRQVSFDLFLDAYEDPTRQKVIQPIRFLNTFLPVANSGKKFTPPPPLIFAWGWFVKRCLLAEMNTEYTMFDAELNPIRATVSLTLNIIQ